jgi:hypothetical protein
VPTSLTYPALPAIWSAASLYAAVPADRDPGKPWTAAADAEVRPDDVVVVGRPIRTG